MSAEITNKEWKHDNITYYAELLPRVSFISVTISPIDAVPSHITRLNSRKVFFKESATDPTSSSFQLPGPVAPDTSLSLRSYAEVANNVLTLRLKAARQAEDEDIRDQKPPLMSSDLQLGLPLDCRTCQNHILRKEVKFLDMPSENWYELMDYWHCHKPDDPCGHHANQPLSRDILKPKKEICLVGLLYILVSRDEVEGVLFEVCFIDLDIYLGSKKSLC
ncbi:ubiquitin-conjugating enzyme E2-binding protein [Lipomyces oligophaga]|uniref:ubiquitin-conjugating enzyme E2-binding protein n=1 Tax=Lipomyces oligophaga TaxID=45792 RepID=UPI0034CE3A80